MGNTSSTNQIPWLILICGCIIVLLSFGPRSAMGFYQLPILDDTGWHRSTFGLAIAIQNLSWGIGQPIVGAIADRYGTWRVVALGGILYALGLYFMAIADAPIYLHIGGGIMVGLGVATGSFSVIMAALARKTNPEHRSIIFGIATAAGSLGMFIYAPITKALINSLGWSDSLIYLAVFMLIIPLLAIPLYGNSQSAPSKTDEFKQSMGEALNESLHNKSYLLLISGFFVCGFQVAFITAHFPAYLKDINMPDNTGVIAISLIGFFNILGSLGSGFIGQKYSKRILLAWIYILRSILVAAFLLLPQTQLSVIIFSILMGILWLSTVPPTNGIVALLFGTQYLALLGGIVFFSHQIGSFLGVWMGGVLYDLYGTYDVVWWLGVALGIFAAIVHWPIKEQAVERAATS